MASAETFSGQSRDFATDNTNANSTTSSTALTVQAVLSSHSLSSNPQAAALETVVSERNSLSSQNAQLWKLVEKQRSGYSQILKEIERVRLERDIYKSRLETLGDDPEQVLKVLKKQFKERNKQSGLKASSSHSGLRTEEQKSLSDPKFGMIRTQSEAPVPKNRFPEPQQENLFESQNSLAPVVGPKRTESLQPNPGMRMGQSPSPTSTLISPASPGPTQSFTGTAPMSRLTTSTSIVAFPAGLSPIVPDRTQHNVNLGTPAPASTLSRESRISLPDEAKRYMATLGDSPLPSPYNQASGFDGSIVGPKSQTNGNGHLNGNSSSQIGASQNTGPSEGYLDLDDNASGDDRSMRSASSLSDRELEPSSGSGSGRESLLTKPMVEDFPMPPQSSSRDSFPDTPSPTVSSTLVGSKHLSDQYTETNDVVSASKSLSRSQLPTARSTENGLQPQFRALPLLVADLPRTKIQVSHSSIRPNDRGKEVLSFVIVIDPGSGKEPWRIEKLYSDVIALDQRVKSLGKSLAKAMPVLPDSKLWKDHAPAKVDQRKVALQQYLQTLILLPLKDKNDVIAFFTSDIVRAKQPVSSAGYKEGYLTKRGKNFGGWKRRYFVLSGSILEYYESRGGGHLGSISITGAQIGRQQRSAASQGGEEDNEYRHAFLIIESKKGQSGSSNRHVLCAESDKERDSWVEVLVRHITGNYQDDQVVPSSSSSMLSQNSGDPQSLAPIHTMGVGLGGGLPSSDSGQTRSSTGSFVQEALAPRKPNRAMSKDDISRGQAVPISQLQADPANAKLFQTPPLLEDTSNPLERPSGFPGLAGTETPLSSSLPSPSPLEGDHGSLAPIPPRSNSELGHYPDVPDVRSQVQQPGREKRRTSMQALKISSGAPMTNRSPDTLAQSPDLHTPRVDNNGKVKISAPMNGVPLPAGYGFNNNSKGKESLDLGTSSDRREKAKSRMFWGFGRPSADKPAPAVVHAPRTVFGVSIEESLEVAQIAHLPAVVFRCIKYLETKKADQEEGIYRLSGSSAVIKSLKDRFNAEGDVDLLSSDEYWDPHAISGLLKTFMRELPGSILTRELHTRFLSIIDFVDAQERIKELSTLIAQLPLANYSLLRALTAHLILIVQNSGVNKMTMRNVGIVFSPTLGIPAGVFSLMLGEFNRVFNVDNTEAVEGAEDSSARPNSKHYSDTAADKLLGLSGRYLQPPTDDASDDGGDDLSIHDESEQATDEFGTPQHSASTASGEGATKSRMSTIAASRGLNLTVMANDQRAMPRTTPGLPVSPRRQNSPRPPPLSSPSASATRAPQ